MVTNFGAVGTARIKISSSGHWMNLKRLMDGSAGLIYATIENGRNCAAYRLINFNRCRKGNILVSNRPADILAKRWATNLGGGNTQNGRDSNSKRLGIKLGHGCKVLPNQIIVRQRGLQYWPGSNIHRGKDYTLHASCEGQVFFSKCYDSKKTFVNVIPAITRPLPRPGLQVPDVFHLYKSKLLDSLASF